ncbi:MAG: type I DNA topoisomerase [Clostridiales bacterium]|nr:type I DNA topoisomerase [Clostridiales bacterium]
MSKLVIVESPAKAKTIKKYLGGDYEVVASMGHIRDLPKSKLGVDVENDFEPQYVNIRDKSDLIKSLTKQAKKSEQVFLATDPDREGEAISWHLAHILDLDLNEPNRVTFNEITKSGIESGMNSPRKIDMELVNAQQARRILDRLVGYKLSPFLWKKVRKGLSAGRVQSVAVRLIVDREEEIRAFVSKEYWSISAELLAKSSKKAFEAKLHSVSGEKIELNTKEETDKILSEINKSDFTVAGIKKSVRRKSPAAPFITSTLQQEASRRLGFQSRRTMKAAQELYEGIEIASLGAVGLITYMRTDSLRISDEARNAAYDYIGKKYGEKYIPEKPNTYRSKRNTQDAHEAIRPTVIDLTPDEIKDSLSSDQYRLYKLIWERFMASQMAKAQLNTVSVDINVGDCGFKASGYSVKFDGFTVLYEEAKDDPDENNNVLPDLEVGQVLKVKSINGNQHFTQPPARYSEATLIKALEENGIGRPSTYAPTITTIISRNYVEREEKRLKPTVLGEVTTQLMKDHFKQIVNVAFTAKLEDSLDAVGEGKTEWVDTLHSFYDDFDKTLTKAEEAMEGKRVKIPDEETDVVCELCGRNMVIKLGRFGRFLACPGFPECKNTKKIVTEADGNCPLCGSKIHEKKSKKGRKSYGCGSYPDCNFMTWDTPIEEKCPQCDSTLFKKGGKNAKIHCLKPDCGFEKAAD